MRRFVVVFAVVMNLVLVDALVKEFAISHLKGSVPVQVVPGAFNLAYVENRGCAWGMLQGRTGALAIALVAWKRRSIFDTSGLACRPKLCAFLASAAECALYAGILGNLIDRTMRGCVVDMFDFHWGVHHFPCFNVADMYITFAAAVLVVFGFLPRRAVDNSVKIA